jgi:hypothetical protein
MPNPTPAPDPGVDLLPPNCGPSIAAVAALDGAIAAALPSFGSLAKDGDNTYLKTSYLTLPALLEAVRPALMTQGVLITSSLRLVPGGFVCQTTLQHSGGGWRTSQFPVGDPSNAQRVAAAATYGLRINLQQLLAVCGVDDDGQPGGVMPQQAAPMWQQPHAAPPAAPPVAYAQPPQPLQQPAPIDPNAYV